MITNVAISILIRTVKQTIRDPSRVLLIVGFPFVFIAVFAFIFADFGGSQTFSIGIVNNEDVDLSTFQNEFSPYVPEASNNTINPFVHGFGHLFLESLQGNTNLKLSNLTFRLVPFDFLDDAKAAVQARAVVAVVQIKNDFSYGILSGINSMAATLNGTPIAPDPQVNNWNATIFIEGDPTYQTFQTARTEIEAAFKVFQVHYYGIERAGGNLDVRYQLVQSVELRVFDNFVAGFFTFGIVLSASSIAGIIGIERAEGTLDRLKLSDASSLEMLVGLTMGHIIAVGTQMAFMFLAALFFGFRGQGDVISAYLIGILTIFPVLGLAFFVAAYIPNGRDANSVIAILSAPIGFLSGSFLEVPAVPLVANIIPDGVGGLRALQLWDFFPFAPSVDAIRKILLSEYSLIQVLPEIFLLLLGGGLFYFLGAIFFLKRVLKPAK
ncbi:MAG: ABC transporter permease [Candidatus Heimdallarchaeota archaeon]